VTWAPPCGGDSDTELRVVDDDSNSSEGAGEWRTDSGRRLGGVVRRVRAPP
jgi:hypothetical protein